MKSPCCLRKNVRRRRFSNSLRRITTSKRSLSKVYTLSSQRRHNLCKEEKIQWHINFSNKYLCYKLQIWCQTLFIANYNSKEQVYIKIHNHSLSEATNSCSFSNQVFNKFIQHTINLWLEKIFRNKARWSTWEWRLRKAPTSRKTLSLSFKPHKKGTTKYLRNFAEVDNTWQTRLLVFSKTIRRFTI